MKKLSIFLFLFCLYIGSISAQQAISNCTSVTVTNTPPFPTVYFTNVGFANCRNPVPAGCCRVIYSGQPTTARYWLERRNNNGTFSTVAGPQFNTTFNNVSKGTYRVRIQVPNIATNECDFPSQEPIECYNYLGQFLGFWGTWDNSPFATTPVSFTNEVLVGPTFNSDISYTFIDIPETGSEQAYDFGEEVIINNATQHYDLWWLAVFESGPTFNRYRSNGWSNGTMNQFNLTDFWKANNPNWKFETFHNYTVQFVAENRRCRNAIEWPASGWNVLNRNYFICPAGTGCQFDIDDREITLSPNPAKNYIRLDNFDPIQDENYYLRISDVSGRLLISLPIYSNEVDISELQNGMYIVNIEHEGDLLLSTKMVVSK
ncbi:MAG: T9SS type A sorting domain-containing protein [Bacteroidota bacterium]